MEVIFSLVGYFYSLHPYPSWNFVISKIRKVPLTPLNVEEYNGSIKKKKFVIQSQETEN